MADDPNALMTDASPGAQWLATPAPNVLAGLSPASNALGDTIVPPSAAQPANALTAPYSRKVLDSGASDAPGTTHLSPVDMVEQRMWQQESGHKQFNPNGSVVTSPAGALGYTQVMPSTGPEAAKLAGLPWDENRLATDTEYNKALGHAYYRAQVAKYGDPVIAAAAYNAGPGAVDSALAQAKSTGQPWTNFLPSETQDYVAVASGQKPTGGSGGAAGAGGRSQANSSPGAIPQGPLGQSDQLKGLLQLALIQAAFPQHKFTPIDYDPFKVRPVVGGPVV